MKRKKYCDKVSNDGRAAHGSAVSVLQQVGGGYVLYSRIESTLEKKHAAMTFHRVRETSYCCRDNPRCIREFMNESGRYLNKTDALVADERVAGKHTLVTQ